MLRGLSKSSELLSKVFRRHSRIDCDGDFDDLIAELVRRAACPLIPLSELLRSIRLASKPLSIFFLSYLNDPVAAKALALKILNLILTRGHYERRSGRLFSRPFGLVVDPSNGCNLGCPGCVHSSNSKTLGLFDWSKGLLTEDRFVRLIQAYGPFAFQIMFCNYGEPLTNLKTPQFIEVAKSYLMQTALSTSLSIPRFDAEAYVRSGLDFMYLSIDGATKPVFEIFRRGGNLDVVYSNIEKLVAAKLKLGKSTPVLRWQYLAFEHNAHEIPLALNLARSLGVDEFTVATPFDVTWDSPEIRPAANVQPMTYELVDSTELKLASNWRAPISDIARKAIQTEFKRFVPGMLHRRGRESVESTARDNKQAGVTCSWLYKNMVMDANGRILPCCAAPRPDSELVFGRLDEGQLDCFNSELYRHARGHFAGVQRTVPLFPIIEERAPHCVRCEWDRDHTEIGSQEVAQYLRSSNAIRNTETIDRLSNW